MITKTEKVPKVRLSLDIDAETKRRLEELSAGGSITETARKSIAFLKLVIEQDVDIILEKKNKERVTLKVL